MRPSTDAERNPCVGAFGTLGWKSPRVLQAELSGHSGEGLKVWNTKNLDRCEMNLLTR